MTEGPQKGQEERGGSDVLLQTAANQLDEMSRSPEQEKAAAGGSTSDKGPEKLPSKDEEVQSE